MTAASHRRRFRPSPAADGRASPGGRPARAETPHVRRPRPHLAVLGAVALLVLPSLVAPGAPAAEPAAVLIGVRVVKQQPGLLRREPAVRFPGQETACRVTGYRGENAQEFYFDVELQGLSPDRCRVEMECPGLAVRTVWVGRTEVPFTPSGERIAFGLVNDTRNPYALHINLRDRPEVLLYYMPKPPLRASGPYRDLPFPAAAAAAEANLMFAVREVLHDMELAAGKEFDGYAAVGGFETNYPRVGRGPGGHDDFPPHFHLFLVVPPGWRIRQASHLHLSDAGALTGLIRCSPSDADDPKRDYPRGTWCPQRDFADRLAFEFKIDDDNALVIRRRQGQAEYRLCPSAAGTFRDEARIEKQGRPWCLVQVRDDTTAGVLHISRQVPGSPPRTETIRYNPQTAEILQRSGPS